MNQQRESVYESGDAGGGLGQHQQRSGTRVTVKGVA